MLLVLKLQFNDIIFHMYASLLNSLRSVIMLHFSTIHFCCGGSFSVLQMCLLAKQVHGSVQIFACLTGEVQQVKERKETNKKIHYEKPNTLKEKLIFKRFTTVNQKRNWN